jgi:hypothetical protein
VNSEWTSTVGQRLVNAWLLRYTRIPMETRNRIPVATDKQITTGEPFKVMFCLRSPPAYKRTRNSFLELVVLESFMQVSHSGREHARTPGRNGKSLRQPPIMNSYK